jgi:hypothetical protein
MCLCLNRHYDRLSWTKKRESEALDCLRVDTVTVSDQQRHGCGDCERVQVVRDPRGVPHFPRDGVEPQVAVHLAQPLRAHGLRHLDPPRLLLLRRRPLPASKGSAQPGDLG